MRPIPPKMREEIAKLPRMKFCIYQLYYDNAPNHDCAGRITWEHAFIYKNQINEPWAIVGCCENHNSGPAMVKDFNQWVALQNATDEYLLRNYPKRDWPQLRKYLNQKYGNCKSKV